MSRFGRVRGLGGSPLIIVLALAAGCPPEQGVNRIIENPDAPDTEPIDTDVEPVDTGPDIPDDVFTGGVKGRICAPNGWRYITDAKVQIEHEWGVATAYTDQDGWFVLTNVPAGDHVVVVDKGSFHTNFQVYIPPNEIIELATEECLRDDLDIAVVTGEYDSIQQIIDKLGVSYDLYDGMSTAVDAPLKKLLLDPSLLESYDIVFFNCGLEYTPIQGRMDEVASNLRTYIESGGSMYASDWAYYLSERAYPTMVEYRKDDAKLLDPATGAAGKVEGQVYDSAMQASLGRDHAEITFDLDVWITPTSAGPGTRVMIESDYKYWDDNFTRLLDGHGPLAVRYDTGLGRVIYTSFHNEPQATLDMAVLLEEIIFAL